MKKQVEQDKQIVARLAAVVLAAFTFSTVAQPLVEEQPELEEVIVTAQKREQRTIDVPMSVSAITGQVIEELNIQNALELSYRVPGLVVQEAGPGSQLYTLRGVGSSVGTSKLVGVYLDEADVTAADPNGQYDLSLYDLARVEVLRGPQGTLYGAGSVGGTVRLITNKPQLDRFGGSAEVLVFNQQRGEPGYELKAALNTPLVGDVLALRFALNYQDWGGWIDQPAAGREDFNDNDLVNARVRALWRINERFDINGTLILHRNDGGGLNIVNLRPNSQSLFQSFIDPGLKTPYVDDYNHYNITAVYDFDSFSMTCATGYTDTWRSRTGARKFEFEDDIDPEIPGSNVYEAYGRTESNSRVFTQELRLGSSGDQAFDWTAGVFYRHSEVGVSGFDTRALGGLVFLQDAPWSQVMKSASWAVFGELSYTINERWEVGAGARYFQEKQSNADPVSNSFQEARFDQLSPRVYLSFAATDGIHVYANLAQGFRSGGFNAPYVEAVGGPGAYKPEYVNSYELGVKMSLADESFYAELAVYYSDYKNMQAWMVMPISLVDVISNFGRAEIKGVELSLQWNPNTMLSLGFNGSIIDTEVVAVGEGNSSHLPGDPLDQVADYGWSVFADYEFNWSAGRPGYLRAGYNRQGPVHMTDRSMGLVNPFGVSDTLGFLYAHVGLNLGRKTLELYVRNLLDEDGISNPYASGFIETQPRPRVFGLRLVYSF